MLPFTEGPESHTHSYFVLILFGAVAEASDNVGTRIKSVERTWNL